MSEPILPFITTDDIGKSEATVVKVDGREIKKNPIDIGEDGLRILQIIAGVISASTRSLGSGIKHIFLENGKLTVSTADVGSATKLMHLKSGELKESDANVGTTSKPVFVQDGVVKELSDTVGSDNKLIKMVNGEIQVSTGNKGSTVKFVYLENGEIKETSVSLGSNIKHVYIQDGVIKESNASAGGTNKFVYFENGAVKETNISLGGNVKSIYIQNGEIKESDASVGSNNKHVYLDNGELKESTTTLGSNAKHVYIENGEIKESAASVGGKMEVYGETEDELPVPNKHYYRQETSGEFIDITSDLSEDSNLQSMGYVVFELVETKFAPTSMKNGSTVVSDANIGSNACFLYMENGELKASKLTVGQNAKLVNILNGVIRESTDNIGGDGKLLKIVNGQIVADDTTNVGSGSSLIYMSNGQLVESTDSIGSNTQPVMVDQGKLIAVPKELAKKEAPALERTGEPRPDSELSDAEKLVPTSPTPTASDPGSMIATKEYVDNFSTESDTYGYGVVDGSICTDAGDNLCITHHRDVGTTTKELTYLVQNDCYLHVGVNGYVDIWSDDTAPALDVLVNDQPIGRLLDHAEGTHKCDNPSCGIPVSKGSTIKIVNVNEEYPLFHTWGTDADVVFTEYKLAPIVPSVEMPKYSKEEAFDIHIEAFSEEGYLAPRRGYLLASIFDERGVYVPSEKSMKIYINDILVMHGRNLVKQVLVDSILDDPDLIGKNAGSVKKMTITRDSNTIALDNPDNFKVYTIDVNPATDKYEYIVALNPGTVTDGVLTFDESLINSDVVVVDGVRQIENIKLTDTGSCLIPVNYHDVIKIRAEKNGTDEFGSAATWPSNFVYTVTSDTTPEATKRYYKETPDGMIDISEELSGSDTDISTLGYTVYEGTYVDANHDGTTDTTEHKWQAIFLKTRHHVASSDDDPVNKDQFILGGFMDGTMFQDDNGNDICKEVPFTEWAFTQDADNLYTYKYIVKKDCMLYMSFLVHANTTDADKVRITLNGREFDYYYENEASLGGFADSDKQLMLPIAAGTVVGFHSKARPDHNIIGTADSGTGTYAIKIKEYKLIASGETADVSNIRIGGGVIDGTVNNVSEVDLTVEGNNKPTYTYKTTKDCLLLIEVNKAVIGSSAIQVQVGSTTVGYLSDNESTDTDNDSMRIPVRANTDIVLVGDGTSNIFSSTPEGSVLRFTELKLTAIAKQVGMPDYDSGVDITSEVTRVTLSESRGFKAPSEGYVLFQSNTLTTTCAINGLVNEHVVYVSGYRTIAGDDFFVNANMVPVREGDYIDFKITNIDGSELVVQSSPKVFFFPLKTVGEINVECAELPIIEHPFDNAVNNPFLDYTKVDKTKLSFTSDTLRKMGYDIDVAKVDIKTKIDVFYPRYDILGNLMKDTNGNVMIDTNKPMFRFEPLVYDQTAGGYGTDDVPFSVQRVGVGASTALICWPTLGVTPNMRMLLRGFNAFKTGVSTPEIDPDIRPTNNMVVGVDTTDLTYRPGVADWAATRGFTGYYIRLTAVVDPRSPNVKVSKSGMFINGQINIDDNGNVCKTLVPYTEWAAKQDSSGKYVYEYTVKTDCWLHADYVVNANSAAVDKVTVTINGEVFSTSVDDNDLVGTLNLYLYRNSCSLPLKRGTKIGFHSNKQPKQNVFSSTTDAEFQSEQYAIKIVEFKMGTELNPAQFPSLAVRVLDCDMGEVDSNLGKTYTWTESELRQIFGPMYSVNESRIEFSTTFYKATSAEGFDSASVKMTDTRDLLQNTAAYLKFPVTISKNDAGENIISVYVPNKGEMLTPVSWDATNSKFIMNPGVLELQNSGMPVGTRMRLNMHISDRRGDMPDELLPNGISPNSKMVRQGDMDITAGNALGNVAYTNEITITESGTCIIMSNFDSDASGVDYTIVAVQALIGGNWTTIQTAPTQTISDGRGVQSFNFPVEAGTKLRIATDAGITAAAGNISGTRSELDAMFTHAHQALCWVIPTGKYQNPELNLPGSAGVIDGSIWKREDGTDEVTEFSAPTATSAYYTPFSYNVKNDCLLFIQRKNSGTHTATAVENCPVLVNGIQVATISDASTDIVEEYTVTLPVAEGSVVTVGDGSAIVWSSGMKYKFTEFKLRATNVLAAMPDWDESKAISIASDHVVQNDGFLIVYPKSGSDRVGAIFINDVEVGSVRHNDAVGCVDHITQILVSKGDVITFEDPAIIDTAKIYPVKMTRTEYPNKMIVPNWSGTGTVIASGGTIPSDGWIVVNTTDRMDDGGLNVLVNGVSVWRSVDGSSNTKGYTANIPVAKNDVVTVVTDYSVTIKFYPAKPTTIVTSETDVLEEKINKNAADIAALSASILGAVYPVGSVYIAVSGSLPEPIAAIGTWVQMATGKTLWNVDPSVTTPGTVIEAGLPDLPAHSHNINIDSDGAYGAGGGGGHPRVVASGGDKTVPTSSVPNVTSDIYGKSDTVQPPAIAVTMWQRTA